MNKRYLASIFRHRSCCLPICTRLALCTVFVAFYLMKQKLWKDSASTLSLSSSSSSFVIHTLAVYFSPSLPQSWDANLTFVLANDGVFFVVSELFHHLFKKTRSKDDSGSWWWRWWRQWWWWQWSPPSPYLWIAAPIFTISKHTLLYPKPRGSMASCDIIVDIFHFVFFILCQLLFATSLTFARGPVCILFSPFGLPILRSLSL